MAPFNDDFGSGVSLSASVEVDSSQADSQEFTVRLELELNSDSLNDLIEEGGAELVVDVSCKLTRFRRHMRLESRDCELKFGPGALYGAVEITPLIVAKSDHDEYRPSGVSAEFGNTTFSVTSGDILGIGQTTVFELDFARTLERDLITFQYSASEDMRGIYRFVLDGQRIVISVGEDLRDAISQMRLSSKLKPYIYMSIYKDCIAAALNYMAANEDEIDELAWARALQRRLSEYGREVQSDEPEAQEISAQILVGSKGIKRVASTID